MIQAFYNQKVEKSGSKIKLKIQGATATATAYDGKGNVTGEDVLTDMLSYSSYILIYSPGGQVKIYKQIHASDYRWLNINRINSSIRDDLARTALLFGKHTALQIDTGVVADSTVDLYVRCFTAGKDGFEIEADQEYSLEPFNTDNLVRGRHPRMTFWDSYALIVNGRELKSDHKGFAFSGDFVTPLKCEEGKDYIDFTIVKYKSDFTPGIKLERDIDCEDVFVETSAGLANCRRVWLDHGTGHFRLYPMGYSGLIKIKLGRKWYRVWNDYLLKLE